LLEDESLCIGDVVFLGATLWTDFALNGNPVVAEVVAQTGMNDFRRIRTLPRYSRLRPSDTPTSAWSPVSAAKPGRSWQTGNTPRRFAPYSSFPASKRSPPDHSTLLCSPWVQSPSQAAGIGLNARHLRYHHQFWNDLRPKTLRGVHTTLVCVTPQLGFSLTPHIRLDKAFNYFAALSRWAGPVQLFPANYLYPDAELGPSQRAPASIFAELLPYLTGLPRGPGDAAAWRSARRPT
jgi:hypothetical protein